MNEKLHELLSSLRLKGMAGALDEEIQRAEKEGAPVSEVIYRLLLEEQAYRQNQSLLYRLKGARIPYDWSLKTFPFDRQPGVNKAQINELAGLAFVERGENIVLVGETGTGKSGLAIGLLRQALLSGYRGRFYNAQDLLDELYASLADRSSARLMRRLCRFDALCIDEIGYLYRKTGAGERLLQADGGALLPEKIDNYHYQFGISRMVRPLPEKEPRRRPLRPSQPSLHHHPYRRSLAEDTFPWQGKSP